MTKYAWWILLTWAVASVVGTIVHQLFLMCVYTAMNSTGAVRYLSAVDDRTMRGRRRWRFVPLLTVLQLPVGVLGAMVSPGGTSPTDRLAGHPDTRSRFAFSRMWRGTGRGAP